MKRPSRKLRLDTETVRTLTPRPLDAEQLSRAVGGDLAPVTSLSACSTDKR